MVMKTFNYMLEIDILRNFHNIFWVSWGVLFKGLGVQKDTQTPCWLRLCWSHQPNEVDEYQDRKKVHQDD